MITDVYVLILNFKKSHTYYIFNINPEVNFAWLYSMAWFFIQAALWTPSADPALLEKYAENLNTRAVLAEHVEASVSFSAD